MVDLFSIVLIQVQCTSICVRLCYNMNNQYPKWTITCQTHPETSFFQKQKPLRGAPQHHTRFANHVNYVIYVIHVICAYANLHKLDSSFRKIGSHALPYNLVPLECFGCLGLALHCKSVVPGRRPLYCAGLAAAEIWQGSGEREPGRSAER